MKSACVHVLLALHWSYQTWLCQGIKHIWRTAGNFFIVSHKPNLLSTGFRTFAMTVRAARNPIMFLSYLHFALYMCIYFPSNSCILCHWLRKKLSGGQKGNVLSKSGATPISYFVQMRGNFGMICLNFTCSGLCIIFSCLHHSVATFSGHKPFHWDLPHTIFHQYTSFTKRSSIDPYLDHETGAHVLLVDVACRWFVLVTLFWSLKN